MTDDARALAADLLDECEFRTPCSVETSPEARCPVCRGRIVLEQTLSRVADLERQLDAQVRESIYWRRQLSDAHDALNKKTED